MKAVDFTHKDANFRILAARADIVRREIRIQRNLLEFYITRYPEFRTALVPLPALEDAPPIAKAMHDAADLTGVGPMAAVAGAVAEAAARAAYAARDPSCPAGESGGVIVENGGDIFLFPDRETVIGLYAGNSSISGRLGFAVPPGPPLAVCSSSGTLGHSLSFGRADLATVVSGNGALADAAATLAGNLVREEKDIEAALERVSAISGVLGVLIVVGEKIGLKGELPRLVKIDDREFARKITGDRRGGRGLPVAGPAGGAT
jgi:hypothetical protein